jgi:hypothetical protein
MPDEAALARFMETKLISTPADTGILFAGVSLEVALTDELVPKRSVAYHVWVGLDRQHDESIAGPLVQAILNDQRLKGIDLHIHAHRGQVRTQKPLDSYLA